MPDPGSARVGRLRRRIVMKFFLDENFPKSAERYLVSKGHVVFDIRGSPDEGIDDLPHEILHQAVQLCWISSGDRRSPS